MATAYDAIGVVLPASVTSWTLTGVPIVPSTGLAKPSPSIARLANVTTCRRAGISGESRGSVAIVPWTIVRESRSPSSEYVWPTKSMLPPSSTCCRSPTASLSNCLETACSISCTWVWIVESTNWRSSGSRLLRIRSKLGSPVPWVTRPSICVGRSAGRIRAANAWPLRTFASASLREWTTTGSIDDSSCLV